MVARSRSSLMFLQSGHSPEVVCSGSAEEEWHRELELSRQRLKNRCARLEEAFRPSQRSLPDGQAWPTCRVSVSRERVPSTPVCDSALSGRDRTPDARSRFSQLVREEHRRSVTPTPKNRISPVRGVDPARARGCRVTPVSSVRDSKRHTRRLDRAPSAKDPCSASPPAAWRREPASPSLCSSSSCRQSTSPSPSRSSSLAERLEGLVPLDVLLACKLGVSPSTPSCDRSFTLIDCGGSPSPSRHYQSVAPTRQGVWPPRHSERERVHVRRAPSPRIVAHPCRYRRASSCCHTPCRCPRRREVREGHPRCQCCYRARHPQGRRHCRSRHRTNKDPGHRCVTMSRHVQRRSNDPQTASSSVDDTGRAATYAASGGGAPAGAAAGAPRVPQSQSVPRPPPQHSRVNSSYIDRIVSGGAVSMDLLKAPELGSSEQSRYVISICREVFMGAIGAQLVYVVTSLMFGNVAVAVIISLLCVQSAFCHCDGRPVAYLVNGLLCIIVGTTVAIALSRNVSGLEPYRSDPVLNTMSYVYVPLCFLFGLFSFFLGHGYHELHRQERRAIVQATNRLVGDRYRVNERSLLLERKG